MSISTAPSSTSRRPGGRTARVRSAILDATLEIVADGGYQSLTIDALATAAAVNKTTIYRNWPTKAALISAAAEHRSENVINTEITGDPERDLLAFLTSVANNINSPVGQSLIVATLNDANEPAVRNARSDFWNHRFQAARPLIRSALNLASATDAEIDLIIEHLIAPLYLRAFITGAPIDRALIENTVRIAKNLAIAVQRHA